MPKYTVTYVIEDDAPNVVALQTPDQPGWSSPLRRVIETGEGVLSMEVEQISGT